MIVDDESGGSAWGRLRKTLVRLTGRGGAFGDETPRPVTKEATDEGCGDATADGADSDDATPSGNPAPPVRELDWPHDGGWTVKGQPDSYPRVMRLDWLVYPGDIVDGEPWYGVPMPRKYVPGEVVRCSDDVLRSACHRLATDILGYGSYEDWWYDSDAHAAWLESVKDREAKLDGERAAREARYDQYMRKTGRPPLGERYDVLKMGTRGDDSPGDPGHVGKSQGRSRYPGDDENDWLMPSRPRGGGRR